MMRRMLVGVVVATLSVLGLSAPLSADAAAPHLAGRLVTQTGAPMAKVKLHFIYAFGVGDDGRTDSNGRFTAPLAETDGTITVSVAVAGHDEQFTVPVRRTASKNVGDIVFSTKATVKGTLDKTAKSAAVSVDLLDRAGKVVVSQWVDGGSKTFSFSWGKPGTYTVRAASSGATGWTYLGHTGEFEDARFIAVSPTTPHTAALSFSKTPGGAISGTAKSTGTPDPGTYAAFMVVRVGAPASDVAAVYADEDGTFSAKGLAPGTYRVTKFYSTVKSLKNVDGDSRFTVTAGKTAKLGTFRVPARYYAAAWGE